MRHASFVLFTAFSCVATAQTLDGINAPVSRTVTIPADEAAFTILAAGSLDSTPQQVKQALQNAGLPNPTVVAIGLGQSEPQWFDTRLQAFVLYSATVSIAAGSAIDTANRLEALRTHLPTPIENLQYSVAFNASQAKVDAIRETVLPQLMEESRRAAQALAAAAGVKLGAVRAVSDAGGVYAYVGASRALYSNSPLLGYPSALGSSGTQYNFYLNVVFASVP